MTDRELLELAAKAAGLRWSYDLNLKVWNPLTDDGDALRLAVVLNILVEHPGLTWQLMQEHEGDKYEQTRRAIVITAAEIGKKMD